MSCLVYFNKLVKIKGATKWTVDGTRMDTRMSIEIVGLANDELGFLSSLGFSLSFFSLLTIPQCPPKVRALYERHLESNHYNFSPPTGTSTT